jgi:hypothetical protein
MESELLLKSLGWKIIQVKEFKVFSKSNTSTILCPNNNTITTNPDKVEEAIKQYREARTLSDSKINKAPINKKKKTNSNEDTA